MTAIHKLRNGDVLKILPIYRKNGGFELYKHFECAWIGNKMIYDDSGKDYLSRMFFNISREKLKSSQIFITRRNFFLVYVNDYVKFISVPQILFDIIIGGIKNYRIDDNNHLLIVSEIKSGFTDYSKSTIIQRDWARPIFGFNEDDEWKEWILSNQPCYLEDLISKMNIFNNLQIIKNVLGNKNILPDLISEYRDIKINKILSNS